MSNELLIETGPHETRVAILEAGRVVELHVERAQEPGIVGNLYKGRVSRVVPAIQAAFVDIGLERDAFLFAGDLQRLRDEEVSAAEEDDRPQPLQRPIAEGVKEGENLLLQVVKESLPGKGARVSAQISLPGRFVVLLPAADGVGVSRRISAPEERQRLEALLQGMLPEGCGVIARTAARGRGEDELRRELERLVDGWRQISQRAAGATSPSLVRRESNLVERAARDLLDESFSTVWVEGRKGANAIRRFLSETDPAMVERVQLLDGEVALFESRGVDRALDEAMRTRIWLHSGGFIVINPTEALVAVDVNSGRSIDAPELEATALETNLEAADEVARQIRLRDLGGIIVVDFIDMTEPEHRAELVARFEAALSRDRVRTQTSQMSDFGLIAVTRKRTRGDLRQRLTQVCPCCSGEGRIKDATTLGLELDRALRHHATSSAEGPVRIRLHSQMKRSLESDQGELLDAVSRTAAGGLELLADDGLGIDEFVIVAR